MERGVRYSHDLVAFFIRKPGRALSLAGDVAKGAAVREKMEVFWEEVELGATPGLGATLYPGAVL